MPIPEFILKKMIVPCSYHYGEGRFSFSLNNTYASGTITRLKVFADGVEISSNLVQYEAAGHPPTSAGNISLVNPAPISTGVRIIISGKVAARPIRLVLWAETKEAGIIQFTVFEEVKHPVQLPTWLNFLRKPLRLELELDSPSAASSNYVLLGLNYSSGESAAFEFAAAQQAPWLVFPPVDKSAGIRQTGWTEVSLASTPASPGSNVNQNGHNIHDFLKFCREALIEPVVALDVPPLGRSDLRSLPVLGDESFNSVNYWVASGTAWQEWDTSIESALSYAEKVRQFAVSIHSMHPQAKVGMLCKWIASGNDGELNKAWNETALKASGREIDFVYWQVPFIEDGFLRDGQTIENLTVAGATFEDRLTGMIQAMHEQLDAHGLSASVFQAIDFSRLTMSFALQVQYQLVPLDRIDVAMVRLKCLNMIGKHPNEVLFAVMGGAEELENKSDPLSRVLSLGLPVSAHARHSLLKLVPTPASSQTNIHSRHALDYLISTFFLDAEKKRLELTLANSHPDRRMQLGLILPIKAAKLGFG
ncbi:hypothetical protein EG834_06980, partial [bacterium]|nr:hypothetical protein [bacterium]